MVFSGSSAVSRAPSGRLSKLIGASCAAVTRSYQVGP